MNGQIIWNFLKEQGFNDYGVAGVLGNIYAESACKPTNLQSTGNKALCMTDDEYTIAVNNGTYTNFVKDAYGYGLCQWTYWSRKQALYNFAAEKDVSIGDMKMQLSFMLKEFAEYKLLDCMKNAPSIYDATKIMMLQYEKPYDQSEQAVLRRTKYAEEFYKQYSADDIDYLTSLGIIESPDYWRANLDKVKYLPDLLSKVVKYLKRV